LIQSYLKIGGPSLLYHYHKTATSAKAIRTQNTQPATMKITIAFALMLVSSVTGRNVRRSRRNKSKSEQKNRELQTDPTNPLACTCIITCIEVDPEPKEPSECLVSEEICTFADGTSCSPSGEGFTGPTSDFCTDVPSANGRISLATFPADSQVVASEVTYR